jgi:hypothetical protein
MARKIEEDGVARLRSPDKPVLEGIKDVGPRRRGVGERHDVRLGKPQPAHELFLQDRAVFGRAFQVWMCLPVFFE